MPELPDLVPVMVGTAGHVHHGKSALVKLLTGCDTMHLPEERKRQLTMDLGFAPCQLGGRRLVGIVDVPGHEDFIRSMVAGASFIDVLLLVVAADDGVMPQTREHLCIVNALRSPQAMAVVNKCDLVEPARAEAVAAEVRALLAAAGFPGAAVVQASCRSGAGLEGVWTELERLVAAAAARPADPRAFRLDVERTFTSAGHGTVVTGVARCGQAGLGDSLELLPAALPCRLGGVQSFKRDHERVGAGSCTALALKDLAGSARRGDTVAAPGIHRAALSVLCALRPVVEDPGLRRRGEIRLHAGTAEVVCDYRLLEDERLAAGGESLAELRLRQPLVLASGDRLLLRALSPQRSVAAGLVLAARPEERWARDPGLAERWRAAAAAARAGDVLGAALLAGGDPCCTDAEALRLTQLPGVAARNALDRDPRLLPLGRRGAGRPAAWAWRARAGEAAAVLARACARHHHEQANDWGLLPAVACAVLGLPEACGGDLEALLALDPERRCALRFGRLGLIGHAPAQAARLVQLKERLLARLAAAGPAAPARGNLLTELACDEADFDTVAKLLLAEGRVRAFGPNLMPTAAHDRLRQTVRELVASQGQVELAAFRQASGLGRNLAVEVLEAFDREGFTRRVGNGRVLR